MFRTSEVGFQVHDDVHDDVDDDLNDDILLKSKPHKTNSTGKL